MRQTRYYTTITLAASILFIQGCQTLKPIHTVKRVELTQFMGEWFVIASIPTPFEKDVYNGIETYRLGDDGTVETTFRFNRGGFDGPEKTYRPKGYIRDTESNAVWDMQFIWPFKAEYRIIYLNDDYSVTVIGRSKRDYVWIMARQPTIPENEYLDIVAFLQQQGYDPEKLQKIPHKQNA